MDFHYDFLLKTLQIQQTKWLEIQDKSYWKRQNDMVLIAWKRELAGLQRQLAEIPLSESAENEIKEKFELENMVRVTSNAKRRDAQRKLDYWIDEHNGPNWKVAEEQLKKKTNLQNEIQSLENNIQQMSNNTGNVQTWLEILKGVGFLNEDNSLTEKGVLATEFNEGHSLLCAEFFMRGFHKDLTGKELLCGLACLMEEKDTENTPGLDDLQVPKAVYMALCRIGAIVDDMFKIEETHKAHSPENYWRLTTTWIEPIWKWLQGENVGSICSEYGLFEGNFVRAVSRIANMVDEWVAIATLASDVELLEKLSSVKSDLIRDIIIPDSLYLHI
jgi:superfamily II RNA helicase